ncbi:MAG: DUF503 domain-containing protein [Thermoleophilaceae bacterium]|nr:DUF503 domain-containing protein [Thermoleophilaceae bacterium]
MPGSDHFVLLRVHLHFPEAGSLKTKRKDLQSVKVRLRKRFGAAVAEVDHHDLWQRSTLCVALVGGGSEEIERFLHAALPDGVRVERATLSAGEVFH